MKTKLNFRKTNLILLIFTISLMGCSSLKNKEQKSSELKGEWKIENDTLILNIKLEKESKSDKKME